MALSCLCVGKLNVVTLISNFDQPAYSSMPCPGSVDGRMFWCSAFHRASTALMKPHRPKQSASNCLQLQIILTLTFAIFPWWRKPEKYYEKRSAGTCWVSGVKFNHGSTSSRWRRLLAVETIAIDRWHDRTTRSCQRALARRRSTRDRSRSR